MCSKLFSNLCTGGLSRPKIPGMVEETWLVQNDEASQGGDFPAFSNGIMMATLQICGQSAKWNDAVNMESNSWRAKGPSDLRNVGGMSSGPTAPLRFIF